MRNKELTLVGKDTRGQNGTYSSVV